MKILVQSSIYSKNYLYSVVIPKLKKLLALNISNKYLKYISEKLDVDFASILNIAINNIIIIESFNTYIITFNGAIKVNNKPLFYWLNTITYGTLSIKGNPFILNVFNKIRGSLNVN